MTEVDSAKVAALEEKVAALEEKVAALDAAVAELKMKQETAKKAFVNMRPKFEYLAKYFAELSSQLNSDTYYL